MYGTVVFFLFFFVVVFFCLFVFCLFFVVVVFVFFVCFFFFCFVFCFFVFCFFLSCKIIVYLYSLTDMLKKSHQHLSLVKFWCTLVGWSAEAVAIIRNSRRLSGCGLCGLVVSAFDFQAGYRGFKLRSCRDNVQTISTPSSYLTCPGLTIKWTGRRLVTDSGTKCTWMIHESTAVQIHVHNNRRYLYVPRVPG